MTEKIIDKIYAGSSPVYEIIEDEKGISITIRSADDPNKAISIIKSAIPTLIEILSRID